jgi:Rrf2 family protein
MRLQKSTLLALYAVLELARDPARQLSTAEIAERYGSSPHHLAKVMRQLVRAGIIRSARGVGGGYRLNVPPNRTTLWDVIERFEPFSPTEGIDGDGPNYATPIAAALERVREEIDQLTRATLQSITLKSLIRYAPEGDTESAAGS